MQRESRASIKEKVNIKLIYDGNKKDPSVNSNMRKSKCKLISQMENLS